MKGGVADEESFFKRSLRSTVTVNVLQVQSSMEVRFKGKSNLEAQQQSLGTVIRGTFYRVDSLSERVSRRRIRNRNTEH